MLCNTLSKLVCGVLLAVVSVSVSAQTSRYLVTNDNNPNGNTATFYSLDPGGIPMQVAVVPTGGLGFRGDGDPNISVMRGGGDCVYAANPQSSDISSIFASSFT